MHYSQQACTELTVAVSGPAVTCPSATQHTHCPSACSVPPRIHPSREKGYTQTHVALSFVHVCYQSRLETTVNASCVVSDLFSRSCFQLPNSVPTMRRVATNPLPEVYIMFQEESAILIDNVLWFKSHCYN